MTPNNGPLLEIIENICYLTGVSQSKIYLWPLQEHQTQAQQNIQQALQKEATPIFIGIEHVAYLEEGWPSHRSAIVIEKSRTYSQFHVHESKHSNIHVVIGEQGFKSPLLFPLLHSTFYFQEMGLLALNLLKLPDSLFHQVELYGLSESKYEEEYYTYLYRTIELVVRAKLFHIQNEKTYQAYRDKEIKETFSIFLVNPDDKDSSENRFGLCLENHQKSYLSVGPRNFKEIFSGTWINRDQLFSPISEKALQPAVSCAQQIFQYLDQTHPQAILWRNREIFSTLEDMLFSEEMLRRLQIPTYSFFSDWFTYQSFVNMGGWSFHLYFEHWSDEQIDLFSMYPFHAAIYSPKETQVHFFPYQYVQPHFQCREPLNKKEDFSCDLAIVHYPRMDAALVKEFNELFELVIYHSPLPLQGSVSTRFLYQLNQYIRQQPYPINSLLWKQCLNLLDYLFYGQARIRTVMALVQKLNHHRIHVYGEGWEKIINPSLCHGTLTREEVTNVYHQSLITLDVSPMYSMNSPAAYVGDIYAAGGFPVIAEPAMEEQDTNGFSFFNRDHLLHFQSLDQIDGIITEYKTNLEKRQQTIKKAQNTWVSQFINKDVFTPFNKLLETKIERVSNYQTSSTGDAKKDQMILQAAVGYLFSATGYPLQAIEIWESLLTEHQFHYFPLALRTLSSLLEIKNPQKAKQLFETVKEWAPKNKSYEAIALRIQHDSTA